MPENIGMALLLAGMILFILYAVLILLYKNCWDKLPDYKAVDTDQKVKISVIVPARNEESNLPSLLDHLSIQSYPKDRLEIIVVDDGSTDGTANIVRSRIGTNLHLLSIDGGSKKIAIDAGVRFAKGDLIVTTDADCYPSPEWLFTINDLYQQHQPAFIAAPVGYLPQRGILAIFQTLDFITLQGITAASVSGKFHSMCNGANLAYERSAFLRVNGFEGIDHLASGDDMLLMHKISKEFPGRVRYLRSQDAIVKTKPVSTWKEFFWQRIRWASKSAHYGDPKIFLSLLLVYLFNLYFVVLMVAGFWDSKYWSSAVLFWIIKTAIELPFVQSVARFYGQQHLIGWFFLMQPLHILYTVTIGLLSQFGSYYWKGRRLK